jgi:UDP-glucose 4-epimerase
MSKTLLITGGTGSFGKAVLEKYVNDKYFAKIIIFSRDESKQDELKNYYSNKNNIKFIIGDVRDKESVFNAFKGVDYIFHAAALKQVPSCEFATMEAIKTNILGSYNVITEAIKAGVRSLTLLSTDKSVYTINSMGLTKALMEKLAINTLSYSEKTKINCVRYGNVIFARGSFIPIFTNQILKKKEITLTDVNMTRFMMKMEDAIDLVNKAVKSNQHKKIFVMKAPAAKMKDVGFALMKLLNTKVKFNIIGIRPGEKIHECLVNKDEMRRATILKKHFIIHSNKSNNKLNYDDYTSKNEKNLNVNEICDLLKKIPEIKTILSS